MTTSSNIVNNNNASIPSTTLPAGKNGKTPEQVKAMAAKRAKKLAEAEKDFGGMISKFLQAENKAAIASTNRVTETAVLVVRSKHGQLFLDDIADYCGGTGKFGSDDAEIVRDAIQGLNVRFLSYDKSFTVIDKAFREMSGEQKKSIKGKEYAQQIRNKKQALNSLFKCIAGIVVGADKLGLKTHARLSATSKATGRDDIMVANGNVIITDKDHVQHSLTKSDCLAIAPKKKQSPDETNSNAYDAILLKDATASELLIAIRKLVPNKKDFLKFNEESANGNDRVTIYQLYSHLNGIFTSVDDTVLDKLDRKTA